MLPLYLNIRRIRIEKGLSQQELAQLIGYTDRSSIAKIESGKVDLTQSKIKAIADALCTTPGELMGEKETTQQMAGLSNNVIQFSGTRRIPILGRIAAGLPILAEQNIEGYTYTDLNGGAEYFGLRVKGDSMNAARINEGDVLIVRQQNEVENGQIAVVMVHGNEATVKRFYQSGNIVTLMPQSTNPAHRPQIYDTSETQVRVIGLVVKNEITF